MSKFEENLDAHLSNHVLTEAEISDELYKQYVRYVGALEALPKEEIIRSKKDSDIHDQFGRVKPFSRWPTKSTRSLAAKRWAAYNKQLKTSKPGQAPDTADPCEDPNFLSQWLDTCVRTGMRVGGLDKQTAYRNCSRQATNLGKAIQGACSDRGLPKKEMEDFIEDLLKGMGGGKPVDIKDLSIEDRQFIQDLKDSLLYKPKSEAKINEDLEDRDEFDPNCWCGDVDYHKAHTAAEAATDRVRVMRPMPEWKKAYVVEMSKHGYYPKSLIDSVFMNTANWTKAPFNEDLEDKDEFTKCSYCDHYEIHPDIADPFHAAHMAAEELARQECRSKFTSIYRAAFHPIVPKEEYVALFNKVFHKAMAKQGYIHKAGIWAQTFKEDLEDKDTFGPKRRTIINGYAISDDEIDEDTLKKILADYADNRAFGVPAAVEEVQLRKESPLRFTGISREDDKHFNYSRQNRLNLAQHKGMDLPDNPAVSSWSIAVDDIDMPETTASLVPTSASDKAFKVDVPVKHEMRIGFHKLSVIFVPEHIWGAHY